ncbi:MAG: conjugative transposon protein TraM, partial [Prevotella sp.]|nr:conjugative transposon protein TraM [Prevotella sp.]
MNRRNSSTKAIVSGQSGIICWNLKMKDMNTNNQTDGSRSGLSDEQRQKMKKYAVFGLMGIICAGCIWFIFAPSGDEKARLEAQAGFNTEIPDPKSEGLIGDKRDAYEQEQIKQKQSERMQSLRDFSSLPDGEGWKQPDDPALPPGDASPSALSKGEGTSRSRAQSPIQTSAQAYRDMNRTLGNFYEKPKDDPEKEEMKKKLEELEAKMQEKENAKSSVDEQLALMEKSYEMAARYMPQAQNQPELPS